MPPLVGSWIKTGIVLLIGLAPLSAKAANTYYVAPTGSDSNAGSMAAPFATLQKANDTAAAGDTILMRAGTYNCTTQITLSKSGTSDANRTKIWAYTGEVPVLDFSNFALASESSDHPAITVTGNWMHLKGLEIANGKVGTSGSHSYSLLRAKNVSNNTFELLNIHNGFGPGLFIDTGTGGNLILNCDSHDNYDVNGSQGDGQNGDGFGVHYQQTGPSTIVRGCRSWNNSDDGYDLISQEVPVTIENNWAFRNGRGTEGNGNGFKMGSSQTGIRHLVQQNVAWSNKDSGFYANHSTGGNTWYNNTSYNNGTQYNMLASSFDAAGKVTGTIILSGSKVHIMRNNIGYPNKNVSMEGVDTSFNTWDLGIAPAASDFASISDTGCDGPRGADGSMPAACALLHLTAGSRMIDKGTNVSLPYVGAAPDLGAYEYGATGGTTGTGGTTTGTGGSATGTGGAAGGSAGTTGKGGTTGSGGSGPGTGGAVGTGNGGNSGSGGSTTASGGTGAPGAGGSGTTTGAGGAGASSGSAGGTTGSGGSTTGDGGTTGETGGASSGCSCDTAPGGQGSLLGLSLLSLMIVATRRRNPATTGWRR
jgi:Right handed beta helix region